MTEDKRQERLLMALAAKTNLLEARLSGQNGMMERLASERAGVLAAMNGPCATLLLGFPGLQGRVIGLETEIARAEQRAVELRRDIARLKAAAATIGRQQLDARARSGRRREETAITESVWDWRPDSLPQDDRR